ncbi:chaplin [Streptomyces sp. MS1.HAVA.3]|uniref:Chaplin n=1 Tax=Streptomyces caledonius TaxID=3134107 RepID=A0ABU8U7V7_9ACTN
MRQVLSRQVLGKGMLTAAAASSLLSIATGAAYAHTGATAEASHSPGVLAGNSVSVPITFAPNVCGNSVDGGAALNPAMGNTCATTTGSHTDDGHDYGRYLSPENAEAFERYLEERQGRHAVPEQRQESRRHEEARPEEARPEAPGPRGRGTRSRATRSRATRAATAAPARRRPRRRSATTTPGPRRLRRRTTLRPRPTGRTRCRSPWRSTRPRCPTRSRSRRPRPGTGSPGRGGPAATAGSGTRPCPGTRGGGARAAAAARQPARGTPGPGTRGRTSCGPAAGRPRR